MMKQPLAVFVICLVVYLANGRPRPEVDCIAAPYTAWSLVRHGSHDVRWYPELEHHVGTWGALRVRADGAWVSMRPPGSAFAAVPFVAPVALFREQPLNDLGMSQLGKLTAAVSVAGAAVFFFLVCRRLVPRAAWPATILLALGTCLCSVASQALWMHGPTVFWLCAALYFLTRPDRERALWCFAAGFALGFAVVTRPTAAFFVVATGGTLVAQRRWHATFAFALGGVLPALLLFQHNWVNFGHPFLGGYENDKWHETPPLWLGLGGLLLAPSRGVLVYSPALFVALFGMWGLLRRREEALLPFRTLLWAWLAAAAGTLLFFARWHDWKGGWCYGPRFLCEAMPIVCLFFALGYNQLSSRWLRIVANVLVGLSVAIHMVGIFGYSGYHAWQHRHNINDQGRSLFELHDTQIEAHTRALWQKFRR